MKAETKQETIMVAQADLDQDCSGGSGDKYLYLEYIMKWSIKNLLMDQMWGVG